VFLDRVELSPNASRIRRFADGIVPGDRWQETLKQAMQTSRCMVALCSPTYFHSKWCQLELSTFLARQRPDRAPIVTPVSLEPKEKLPPKYRNEYQVYEMHDYVIDGPAFRESRLFPDFLKRIRQLSEIVARSICEAPDFEPFRARVEPYLAPHRLGEAKVAHEETIVQRGDWKLVWENNRECYHCAANHPELCRTFAEAAATVGGERAAQHPEIAALWDRCERAGLPCRFEISADAGHRVVRMPLAGDAVSYTMTGAAAVARPLADLGEGRLGTLMLYHYPSVWTHVLADHAVTFRVLPRGPRETELTTRWLVHKDAVEGVDYSVEDLTRVWRATNDQDRRVVEENQRGISSPAYRPGPYSPEEEAGVAEFVDWYCATVRQALEPAATGLREVA